MIQKSKLASISERSQVQATRGTTEMARFLHLRVVEIICWFQRATTPDNIPGCDAQFAVSTFYTVPSKVFIQSFS